MRMSSQPWVLDRDMFLSVDETRALLKSLETAEANSPDDTAPVVDRVLVETLLLSGIKNSEFCRLALADVTLSTRAAVPSGELRVVSSPTERRTIVIPARLVELLDRFVREVRPGLKHTSHQPRDTSGPLVPNERGNPFDRTALYRRVVRVLTAHGMAHKAGVQLLRHTYGYLAYLGTGGNLLFVQRQLGHAHPMVTAVYADFVAFDPRALANAVVPVTEPIPSPSRSRRRGAKA
jgi:integrase/recombinase XerD